MPRKRDMLLFGIVWLVGFLLLANLYRWVDEERHYMPPNYALFKTERLVLLGDYIITAYCSCEVCTGKSEGDKGYGITASGTVATNNRTVATSNELPFGTILVINDKEYVVEDRGGAIVKDRVDLYIQSHEDCLQFGRQETKVYMLLKEN